MSKAFQCDRCHKAIEGAAAITLLNEPKDGFDIHYRVDLCQSCLKDLAKFMKNHD